MRKLSFVFVIIGLFVLNACSTVPSDKRPETYEIEVSGNSESRIFKDSVKVLHSERKIEPVSKTVRADLQLGKQSATANLTATKTYANGDVRNVYLSDNKKFEYEIGKNSPVFLVRATENTVLSEFQMSDLTEENLLAHIKSYIKDFINLEVLDDYVYSCETGLSVTKESASWGDAKPVFYKALNDDEHVIYYHIRFRKYVNSIATTDVCSIFCDNLGNIRNFYYIDNAIDWTTVSFDQEKVERSVDSFLKESIHPELKMVKYEIREQYLTYKNNEISLSLSVAITLREQNGSEYSILSAISLKP